jgi:hypothetical protein
LALAWPALAAGQAILRPPSGVTVIEPTFEPPYRLTIHVYVTAEGGRRLAPGLGANVLLVDPQGRRAGMDASGVLLAEIPNAKWLPLINPQPNAPIGPRGLTGSGIELDDPPDGRYVLEVNGTDRVGLDIAVAQWDRAGKRRWLHLSRGGTEPAAVDRWTLDYTAAVRPSIDLAEQRDETYLLVRAYGTWTSGRQADVSEMVLTDPGGRRLGFDPKAKKKTYAEVPRASYGGDASARTMKELEVMQLADGVYTLEVIGTRAGRYDIYMSARGSAGDLGPPVELNGIPTAAGATHRYALRFARHGPETARLGGALVSAGQLLSYAQPTAPRVEVARRQPTVTLVIFYAAGITPASFRATLDGADVTTRFTPVAGGHQVVSVPLAADTTTLLLSVDGKGADGETVSHADRFVFVRR